MCVYYYGDCKNKNAKICVFEPKPVKNHRRTERTTGRPARDPHPRNHWRRGNAGGPSRKVEKAADLWYNTLFGAA